MIGWAGFLVSIVMVAGFFLFAVVALRQLRKESSWRNIILTLLFVPISLLLGWKETVHVSSLSLLHHLRSDMIEEINVGGRAFKSPEEKAAIVKALNEAQWFEPKHGGWRVTVRLTVRTTSGKNLEYSVARYRSGAVVLGRGDAFSEDLPSILSQFGSSLPNDVR